MNSKKRKYCMTAASAIFLAGSIHSQSLWAEDRMGTTGADGASVDGGATPPGDGQDGESLTSQSLSGTGNVTLNVFGGNGGIGGDWTNAPSSATAGSGGNGGSAGAIVTANAASPSSPDASAVATATAGSGGQTGIVSGTASNYHAGKGGGGGSATATANASSDYGGYVVASATLFAGEAGASYFVDADNEVSSARDSYQGQGAELENAVDGSTTGILNLIESVTAGNGGVGTTAEVGGSATATLDQSATYTASLLQANVSAKGGVGSNTGIDLIDGSYVSLVSGEGGFASAGIGLTGQHDLNLTIASTGGGGGGDDTGGTFIGGGAAGGEATGEAQGVSTGGGNVTISVTVTGGRGGDSGASNGYSYYAGNGSDAILGTIYGTSNNNGTLSNGTVNITATAIGGSGGNAYSADGTTAIAGTGAAVFISNTIIGYTTGNLTLQQNAVGGNGGSANGNGTTVQPGASASSNMTISGTYLALTVTTNATGGNGGAYNEDEALASAGNGGVAIAETTADNAGGLVTASASAYGGTGGIGSDLAANGTMGSSLAIATAEATGTTLSTLGIATATASSNNGNASAYAYSAGSSAYANATASNGIANATAEAYGITLTNVTSNGTVSASVTSATFPSGLTVHYLATDSGANVTLPGGTFNSCTTHNNGSLFLTGGNASLGDITGNGTISVANGTSLTASTLSMPSGTLIANGNVTFTSTSATRQTLAVVIEIGNLTVGTAGKIDLANHDMIIHGGSNLSQVAALITSAYDSGAWDGDGINSSTVAAASDKAIGYATAGELGISTFDGIAVSSSDILVKYTWQGDANLDGKVNLTDENIVLNNLGSPGDWSDGDMNYDGSVGLSDLNIVSNHSGDGSSSPLAVVATPEPSGLFLLSLGTLGLLKRRRMIKSC